MASPSIVLHGLERFEVAPGGARRGEFIPLGILERGILRFDMVSRVCGDGNIDTAAIRKNMGLTKGPIREERGAVVYARTREFVRVQCKTINLL